jgi:hypothetical protein
MAYLPLGSKDLQALGERTLAVEPLYDDKEFIRTPRRIE